MKKKHGQSKENMYGGICCLLVSATVLYAEIYYNYQTGISVGFIIVAVILGLNGLLLLTAAFSETVDHKILKKIFPGYESDLPVVECKECFYDLRGSVLSSADKCPECGATLSKEQMQQIRKLNHLN
ncbi:MAG: hypothetical protein AAGB26_17520 [Planctomycetota bacterium]